VASVNVVLDRIPEVVFNAQSCNLRPWYVHKLVGVRKGTWEKES